MGLFLWYNAGFSRTLHIWVLFEMMIFFQAFNTFIDDVFAFIITMPTAHRLACFRDDLVFVIYLYQRWWVTFTVCY